ncbi:acyl-CoA thioesterase II [Aspergillus luchuensis]|uniref:Acyl-CoA thioesterase II n=1 Tax=Aspergillus kawachii TaxID=1069201 RepID=A0A146FNZ6_ASPKA|nr:acyl-CoA thioesterase II [Aspergillus luchuensis]
MQVLPPFAASGRNSSSVAQVSFKLFESLEHLLDLRQLEYVTQF